MAEFEVDTEVVVFDKYKPHTTWMPGVITWVGRALLDIKYGPAGNKTVEAFRMQTRELNGGFGSIVFRTVAEIGDMDRHSAAEARLRKAGVSVQRAIDFSANTLEDLADVADPPKPAWFTLAIVRGDQGGTNVNTFRQAGLVMNDEIRTWVETNDVHDDPEAWIVAWRDGENIGEIVDVVAIRQFQIEQEG